MVAIILQYMYQINILYLINLYNVICQLYHNKAGNAGDGTGYPLQYSCQQNSMDRGAWCTTVYGVTNSGTQLSDFER